MESKLFRVEFKNYDKEIFITNYADCIVYDKDTSQLVMMHFGGYSETVRSMADAIYAGGSITVNSDSDQLELYSVAKGYIKTLKKDSPYTKCLIQRTDDIIMEKDEDEDEERESAQANDRTYIITSAGDTDRLFREINKKTSVPMISEYADYIIDALLKNNLLIKLQVMSINVPLDGYCLIRDEDKIAKIVETGVKEGHLVISGADKNIDGFKDIDGVSSYLKKFGPQIAEKIKKSFVPLFDPETDRLSDGVIETDDHLNQTRGIRLYEAQKVVAESLKRKLEHSKIATLVAECGSGKTVISSTAIYALYKGKREKTFNVVLGPGHLAEKWVREVEWTYKNACGHIAKSITDLDYYYDLYSKGTRTFFVFISKERARDGYMRKPAVRWSKIKRCYVCPDCNEKQEMDLIEDGVKYTVDADALFYRSENSANHKCKHCGSVLWTAVNPDDRRYNEWTKIANFGWVYRPKIKEYFLDDDVSYTILESFYEIQNSDAYLATPCAYRRFALSTYIKKKMRYKIDTLIADELHLYKGGDTSQGASLHELVKSSKKIIGMTATLINGYSSGIYYILYRCFPELMRMGGFAYKDEDAFNKEYGAFETTYELKEAKFNAMGRGRKKRTKSKLLPSVSPLVFTRFLLDNCAFLSLADMTDGMPDYEEVPIILPMDDAVKSEYKRLEDTFKRLLQSEKDISKKMMSEYLVLTTLYPDMPYGMKPIVDPKDGSIIIEPADIGNFDTLYEKEKKVLEIVKEKVAKGERVLIYTSWVSTDTQDKLLKMLKNNGYRVKILKSTVPTEKREAWLMKTVEEGNDVLITNPSLVETGLDLNDYVNIIYFNVSYNLFTFRQASRRSWRINQVADKVTVYLLCYEDTMQFRAIRLMATKLAVATTIEGSNVSDEGLAALGDVSDMTTALSRELAQGISNNIEDVSAIYKRMAIKSNRIRRPEEGTEENQLDISTAELHETERNTTDDRENTQIRLQEESEKLRLMFKASKPANTKKRKYIEGQLDLFSMLDVA